MKRPLFTLVIILTAFAACRPKMERVLPFTPPLQQRVISSIPDNVLVLFPLQERIFTLTRNGTLMESPAGTKRLDLGQTIRKAVFFKPSGIVLQTEHQISLLSVGLQNTELRPLNLPKDARLVDANSTGMIFQHDNQLKWLPFSDQKVLDTDIDPQDFLSLLEDNRNTQWLICKKHIYFKHKDQTAFQRKDIQYALHPPIAIIDRHLWAMTNSRDLIRYNLDRFSPSWIKELDHQLLFHPVRFEKQVLLVTRSSTMLSLSEKGSQRWFASLGGIPLAPPMILEKQIVLLVRIRDKASLQVYDFHGRQIGANTLGEAPDPPFLLHEDALLYSSRGAEKKLELRSASTQYGSSVSISPDSRIPQDALIPISVSSINLIEAIHLLTIKNQAQETIWSAEIKPLSPRSPVWKSQAAGNYTLHLESKSKNRPPIHSDTRFTVFDRRELFRTALKTFLDSIFLSPPIEKK